MLDTCEPAGEECTFPVIARGERVHRARKATTVQIVVEVKSMRTAPARRHGGIASMLLEHIIGEAKRMGFTRLSLETGSYEFFLPARKLYEKFRFEYCAPFADYQADPNSVFMTRQL
jgi:GNAT superfamily N-acetyltransferase